MQPIETRHPNFLGDDRERIQSGQYSVQSQFDAGFDLDKFIALQLEGLHPEFAEKLPELCDGIFTFDNANPSLLAFNLVRDGEVVGVSYGFARDLTEYKVVEVKNGVAVTRPFADAIREQFPEIGDRIYTLDLGGAYIKPSERGKGAYSVLFKERLMQIADWVNNKKIIFADAEGNEIPNSQVLFGVSNKGKMQDQPGLAILKQNGWATADELAQLGTNINDFGIPRDESAAVSNHIKKHYGSDNEQISFVHVANGTNHGGPIYSARIPLLK